MQRVMRSGVQWLALAAEDAEDCRNTWQHDPRAPYVLSVGRHFELLAVDQELGMETFDQLRRRRMPVGPVMVDWAARKLGFLLSPGSRTRFLDVLSREAPKPPAHRYLSEGGVAVVPGPLTWSGDRYEWLVPPVEHLDPSPARTVALAVMLAASADLIERARHYGETDDDAE